MAPLHIQLEKSTLRKVLKRLHYPLDVMLLCVRWYVAYPLSLRNLEEMMAERGVEVDHSTVHRWALKIVPVLAAVFRRRKRPVGSSWRCDETYIKVGGQWKYLYRAVDKLGHTVDFLLTAKRDVAAARRFFERAIDLHDVPEKITIDKSGANTAAVHGLVDDSGVTIELRRSKYLNNLVEQDHRAVKRRTRPMLGFKDFWSAAKIIAGIETTHMIRKGQLACPEGQPMSADRLMRQSPYFHANFHEAGRPTPQMMEMWCRLSSRFIASLDCETATLRRFQVSTYFHAKADGRVSEAQELPTHCLAPGRLKVRRDSAGGRGRGCEERGGVVASQVEAEAPSV